MVINILFEEEMAKRKDVKMKKRTHSGRELVL